jgi:hypothetical protein
MMTHSGRWYMPYFPMAPLKWSLEDIFGPVDLNNIKEGLHNLPGEVDSWLPKFFGIDDTSGNLHW